MILGEKCLQSFLGIVETLFFSHTLFNNSQTGMMSLLCFPGSYIALSMTAAPLVSHLTLSLASCQAGPSNPIWGIPLAAFAGSSSICVIILPVVGSLIFSLWNKRNTLNRCLFSIQFKHEWIIYAHMLSNVPIFLLILIMWAGCGKGHAFFFFLEKLNILRLVNISFLFNHKYSQP